jgi:hypothetical protein
MARDKTRAIAAQNEYVSRVAKSPKTARNLAKGKSAHVIAVVASLGSRAALDINTCDCSEVRSRHITW